MLHNQTEIKAGLEHFLGTDARFQALLPNGHIKHREDRHVGLAGLSRIVIGQQISAKVANTLWAKYQGKVDPSDAGAVLTLSDEDLRECGLSRQKMAYLRGAATAIQDGAINPDDWAAMDADDVAKIITSLKGFGPWSAQVYILFCLGKGDVWPAGDLGVQIGLQTYLGLSERPDEKQTLALGEQFKPYRSAAALLLWDVKEGESE